jgi:hypothetical protein
MFKARMYLDFNGVINAVSPEHPDIDSFGFPIENSPYFAANNHITYSPTVIRRIDEFRHTHGIELVWLSTLNVDNHVLKLSKLLSGLDGGRVVPASLHTDNVGPKLWTEWKYNAILADQKESRMPFIWVDDKAAEYWGEEVLAGVDVESLFITTDARIGLSITDFKHIDEFMKSLHSTS